MENKELLLHQTVTGRTRCEVLDRVYYVCAASPAHRMEAAHIYENTIYEASFQGVLTDEEMVEVMIQNDLWSMDEETELESAPSRMDALKVEMYQRHTSFQSRRVEQARRMLTRLRKRHGELAFRRHQYDLHTQNGLAHTFRLQYLISRSTKDVDDNVCDFDSQPEWLLRLLLENYMRHKPGEDDLRALAQYDKWRMIWSSGRHEGRVFGIPSIWFTDEQQTLIAWSKLYDNIQEHPEPPAKEIIEDNDLLDGWIIVEQRKREKEQREKAGGGNKQGNQEVYIPVETAEDAQRVEAMNEKSVAFIKRQRMAALKKDGVVKEQHMPDSKQEISVQAAQQFRDRMKTKGRR